MPMSAMSAVYWPPRAAARSLTYPAPTYRVRLARGTTNGTSSFGTCEASRLTWGSGNSSADVTRKVVTVNAAATAPAPAAAARPGTRGRGALTPRGARDGGCHRGCFPASPKPTAAPTTGPRATFCGRRPSAPAAVPAAVATGTVPAPASPATQPAGAASAPLIAIRAHSAGISLGRCRARATASTAPSPAAQPSAPSRARFPPRCPERARPAIAPMTLAVAICCPRSGILATCLTLPGAAWAAAAGIRRRAGSPQELDDRREQGPGDLLLEPGGGQHRRVGRVPHVPDLDENLRDIREVQPSQVVAVLDTVVAVVVAGRHPRAGEHRGPDVRAETGRGADNVVVGAVGDRFQDGEPAAPGRGAVRVDVDRHVGVAAVDDGGAAVHARPDAAVGRSRHDDAGAVADQFGAQVTGHPQVE